MKPITGILLIVLLIASCKKDTVKMIYKGNLLPIK